MIELDEAPEIVAKYTELAKTMGISDPYLSFVEAKHNGYELSINNAGTYLSRSWLSHFPGCCGIAILHDSTAKGYRWLKFHTLLREELAKASNIGLVQFTHNPGNRLYSRLARELGYTVGPERFFNPNSRNRVNVYSKVIGAPRGKSS